MDAERPRFIGSGGNDAAMLRVSAHNYRLSLQLRVKHLLHGKEAGIQINMENTASHETAYKLAHRADIALSTVAVSTTPAEKAAIAGLVVLLLTAFVIWAIRRRGKGPECT